MYGSTYLSFCTRQLISPPEEGGFRNCENRYEGALLTTQQFVTRKTQITPKLSRLHNMGLGHGAQGVANRPHMGGLLLIADSSCTPQGTPAPLLFLILLCHCQPLLGPFYRLQ
ncbi:hypothetical protein GOODEAATRI_005713 [Goodea atripinnis]|uniref:Uncharacterized protein n=1 Tax=Goodea atripinnis TaxID=208336 RepID=A0ABV0NJ93_9TELE